MGRDSFFLICGLLASCFNPRARMGRDNSDGLKGVLWKTFQSTRPHGARRIFPGSNSQIKRFNPRARMGRDGKPGKIYNAVRKVSIHAPAWGAT